MRGWGSGNKKNEKVAYCTYEFLSWCIATWMLSRPSRGLTLWFDMRWLMACVWDRNGWRGKAAAAAAAVRWWRRAQRSVSPTHIYQGGRSKSGISRVDLPPTVLYSVSSAYAAAMFLRLPDPPSSPSSPTFLQGPQRTGTFHPPLWSNCFSLRYARNQYGYKANRAARHDWRCVIFTFTCSGCASNREKK